MFSDQFNHGKKFNALKEHLSKEQAQCENARLPPMWPGVDSTGKKARNGDFN